MSGRFRPGVMLPGGVTLGEAQRLAAESEAAGAEAVWVADVRREPYLLAAAALSTTSRVEVGTNVAVAFSRSPAATAQAAWDLAGWSGGRFTLGLGSQVSPTLLNRFGVEADRPAPRIKDYIGAVRSCWNAYRQGHGRHEGPFYRIRQPVFMPGADEPWPEPPIYLAGVNPVMTRVAGECADGFAAHMFATTAYLDEVIRPALATGAAGAGRPDPPILMSLVVAESRAALAHQMTAYTVPGYRRVLDHAGLKDVADQVLAALAERRRSEAQQLVDKHVLELLGVVLLDDLAAGIARWAGHADRLALSVPWFGIEPAEQLDTFRQVLRKLESL